MTSQEKTIFYSVIKTSIASKELYDAAFDELVNLIPNSFNWNEIIKAFEDHAIIGIVAHTVGNLPSSKQPSQQQIEKIMLYVASVKRAHWKMQQTIILLFKTLENKNIHPILLKGEGLSALYPETLVRACGDIDIYVEENNFSEACNTADLIDSSHCGDGNYFNDSLHYRTSINGIIVEIHRHPAETSVKYLNDDFNQWAKQQLMSERCDRFHLTSENIVLIPPQPYNTLFVFDHLCKHLLNDGSALRQIIDWLSLIREIQDSKDIEELRQNLLGYHLLRPWQILSGILHCQLGVPQNKIPFYNPQLAQKSQTRLLNQITEIGNFGKNATHYRQHTGILRTLGAIRHYFNCYLTNCITFPSEAPSICKYYISRGIRNRINL